MTERQIEEILTIKTKEQLEKSGYELTFVDHPLEIIKYLE